MTQLEIEAATRPLLTEAASLEKKAKELRALAADYEEKLNAIYGAPRQLQFDATEDTLIHAIRTKNGRVKDYADRLHTTTAHIEKLITLSNGRIIVGQRGWLDLTENFQVAA
jgi:predicted aminopeptidase